MNRLRLMIVSVGFFTSLSLRTAGAADRDPRQTAYITGRSIRQTFYAPTIDPNLLNTLAAGPGQVSPGAISNVLYQSADAKARLKNGIVLLPGTTASTVLPLVQAPIAAPGPTLHKFNFSLGVASVKFSRLTHQSALVRVDGNQRRILFVRNRNMPNPDEVPTLQATVSQPAAEQIALHDATAETGLVDLQVDRVYLPVHQEIYVDEGGHPLLAWTILIRRPINVRTRALSRRYWIAARGEPRILAKEDLIQRDAVVGSYWKLSDSPLGQSQQGPLAFLNVGTAAGTSIISDKNGEFTKAAGMVFSDALHGPFCEIRNDAAPAGALQPQTSGNQRIFPGSTELHLSQVSAFHWITQARLFVDDFLPHNPTILNVIPTHVNVDDECNAFWDPPTRSLNFFRASTPPRQCVNTAYAQIVFHEYGHAVDEQFEGIMDKAYSEGFGDALSMLITRGSLVGRDFHGPNQHLRDNKQVVRWPVTGETEPHTIGQAYAGFVWQLTRELKSKFNGNEDQAFAVARHLILGAAQLNPQSIPEAVIWSFYVDHQAGGTYFHQLAAAADSRKLPRPAQPTDLESLQQIAALVGE